MPWPESDVDHVMVTSESMAIFEQELIKSGLEVASLMEKVGLAMADWILRQKELIKNGVLILVGPGHNGGDGLVVARELHHAGIKVAIWCPFPVRKNLTINHLSHIRWLGIDELKYEPNVNENILWIDALFGLNQKKPLPDFLEKLFKKRQLSNPSKLICLDIPSGICSDSGMPINKVAAVGAFTLTAGLLKQGLIQDIAIPYVGKIIRINLGITDKQIKRKENKFPLSISPKDISTIPWPVMSPISMKYQRGRVFVIAGSDSYRGASLLALKGAIASGVGCIYAVLPNVVSDGLWQFAPEVILKGSLGKSSGGDIVNKYCLKGSDLDKVDVLLLGPGLVKSAFSFFDCLKICEKFQGLLVLDADAINQLAGLSEGWHWLLRREGPTWLTPHSSEFSRLFPELIGLSPLLAAKKAAEITGASILLKGAHSVVAEPDGQIWQLSQTAPWVARAGWGDVLAGFVSGVGALGLASSSGFHHNLLAAGTLMHSAAAFKCQEGSNASLLGESLGALVRGLQAKSCA